MRGLEKAWVGEREREWIVPAGRGVEVVGAGEVDDGGDEGGAGVPARKWDSVA